MPCLSPLFPRRRCRAQTPRKAADRGSDLCPWPADRDIRPSELTWSPDGKHLTYLDGGELIDLDPATGKAHVLVSRAKLALSQERGSEQRPRSSRALQAWPATCGRRTRAHLLFDSNGRLWLYDLHNGTGLQIGLPAQASGDDPKFSPNGKYVSFIRDHGLAVGAAARAVRATHRCWRPAPKPGDSERRGGLGLRGRVETRSNYFWSPDSKNIAYLQTNEPMCRSIPITDWIPSHARWIGSAIRSRATPIPLSVSAWSAPRRQNRLGQLPIGPATTTFPASAGSTAGPRGSRP